MPYLKESKIEIGILSIIEEKDLRILNIYVITDRFGIFELTKITFMAISMKVILIIFFIMFYAITFASVAFPFLITLLRINENTIQRSAATTAYAHVILNPVAP